jgi:hypothetical protein
MFLDSATVSVIDWGADAVDWGAPAGLRLYNAHHHLGWEAAAWMLGQSCPCTMLNPPPNIDL